MGPVVAIGSIIGYTNLAIGVADATNFAETNRMI